MSGQAVADGRPGRQWSLPLEDRALLVAAYYQTVWQVALLFGVTPPAVYRIIDRLGLHLL